MRARIITFEEFDEIRDGLGRIVATSGGFDPVHAGHLYGIHESKKFGDTMVVIVNGDTFLRDKKGKPFMPLKDRMDVISYISGVDYVIPYETEKIHNCIVALSKLRPHVFTKSGNDRTNRDTIPEWDTCEELGIEIVIIPPAPTDSVHSSNYLKRWNMIFLTQKFKLFVNPYNRLHYYISSRTPRNLKEKIRNIFKRR